MEWFLITHKNLIMAVVLILLGIGIWFFWAQDIQKGNEDFGQKRLVHDTSAGCIPYAVAFLLIGIGIYLAISN